MTSKHSYAAWSLSLALMLTSARVYRDSCVLEIWFSHPTPLNFCHQFLKEICTRSETGQPWIPPTQFPDLYLTKWRRVLASTHTSQHFLPSAIPTALTVHLTHVDVSQWCWSPQEVQASRSLLEAMKKVKLPSACFLDPISFQGHSFSKSLHYQTNCWFFFITEYVSSAIKLGIYACNCFPVNCSPLHQISLQKTYLAFFLSHLILFPPLH